MSEKRIYLYIDGAARGNPGPAGIGVVLFGSDKKKIKDFHRFIGNTTNNIAEYNALIYGLQEALILGAKEVVVNLDSELIAQQLKGEYRVRNANIKPLFEQVAHLLNGFDKVEVKHIDRKENKEADRLANKAINLSGFRGQVG